MGAEGGGGRCHGRRWLSTAAILTVAATVLVAAALWLAAKWWGSSTAAVDAATLRDYGFNWTARYPHGMLHAEEYIFTEVTPGRPMAAAGLQVGDQLDPSWRQGDFVGYLADHRGQAFPLPIVREGKRVTVTVHGPPKK